MRSVACVLLTWTLRRIAALVWPGTATIRIAAEFARLLKTAVVTHCPSAALRDRAFARAEINGMAQTAPCVQLSTIARWIVVRVPPGLTATQVAILLALCRQTAAAMRCPYPGIRTRDVVAHAATSGTVRAALLVRSTTTRVPIVVLAARGTTRILFAI